MAGRALKRGAGALAAITALGIALTGCAGQADVTLPDQVDTELSGELVDQIDAATTIAMQATGSSGAIVGVWVPWSGTYVAGLGTTGVDSDEPVTTDMSFRVADATRAMTCDVLYALDDEGMLSVDDPVSEHVLSVPKLTDVTLQQLCDSTSGLGSSEAAMLPQWLSTPERRWAPRELAARGLISDEGLRGAGYRDSDAGYMLLGQALEHVTGKSATELIEEYVAEPNDLDDTSLPSPAPATPGTVYLPGYRSSPADAKEGCVAPAEYSELSASVGYTDSGVVSTIDDLGRYAQIVAARSAAESDEGRYDHLVPTDPNGATWHQYGGGVFHAGTLLGQRGAVPGYASSVWADPATGMTVAVVLNNSRDGGGIAGYLGRQIAAIASKAPAADGRDQPEFGLPWTAERYDQFIRDAAICPIDG